MILKPDLIYAEFLKHFVDVLQDEKMRDAASMASGCLRSPLIPSLMGDLLSKDETLAKNDESVTPAAAPHS